jgi:hypothetical protein
MSDEQATSDKCRVTVDSLVHHSSLLARHWIQRVAQLVAHVFRVHEVEGSNPSTLTVSPRLICSLLGVLGALAVNTLPGLTKSAGGRAAIAAACRAAGLWPTGVRVSPCALIENACAGSSNGGTPDSKSGSGRFDLCAARMTEQRGMGSKPSKCHHHTRRVGGTPWMS